MREKTINNVFSHVQEILQLSASFTDTQVKPPTFASPSTMYAILAETKTDHWGILCLRSGLSIKIYNQIGT